MPSVEQKTMWTIMSYSNHFSLKQDSCLGGCGPSYQDRLQKHIHLG